MSEGLRGDPDACRGGHWESERSIRCRQLVVTDAVTGVLNFGVLS